jgi:hypothetical protein
LDGDLLGLVRRKSTAEINALLEKTLGPGYRFECLMAETVTAPKIGDGSAPTD